MTRSDTELTRVQAEDPGGGQGTAGETRDPGRREQESGEEDKASKVTRGEQEAMGTSKHEAGGNKGKPGREGEAS